MNLHCQCFRVLVINSSVCAMMHSRAHSLYAVDGWMELFSPDCSHVSHPQRLRRIKLHRPELDETVAQSHPSNPQLSHDFPPSYLMWLRRRDQELQGVNSRRWNDTFKSWSFWQMMANIFNVFKYDRFVLNKWTKIDRSAIWRQTTHTSHAKMKQINTSQCVSLLPSGCWCKTNRYSKSFIPSACPYYYPNPHNSSQVIFWGFCASGEEDKQSPWVEKPYTDDTTSVTTAAVILSDQNNQFRVWNSHAEPV